MVKTVYSHPSNPCLITGRPARSTAMTVLFLLTGPKMGFLPSRVDTLPR